MISSTFHFEPTNPCTEAIECLLKNRAFVVKKTSRLHHAPDTLKTGQVTWSKFGGIEAAWQEAKRRAGHN